MRRFLALLLAFPAVALAIPEQITAEYQITNLGITIGRVHETFVRRGDNYSIQSVTRSEGPLKILLDEQITLESSGKVVASGLRPLRFEQRRARNPRRDVDATFDWERGVIHSTFQGERSEIPLPGDTQDRLSLMYQFMKLTPRGGAMKLPMSNGRKVEVYSYRLVNEERLSTPAGEFDTLHFERVTASDKESKAEVWLAKDRHNFPVRVVFDDPRGLRLEQTLVALQTR
jgi:uncharacterized protein DUF3108